MADESSNFVIRIVLEAVNQVRPALEAVSKEFDKLDRKADEASRSVEKLDDKLSKVGTKTARPKVELSGEEETDRKIDKLIVKLNTLEKKRAKIPIEAETRELDRQITKIEAKIEALGGEHKLGFFRIEQAERTQEDLNRLRMKAEQVAQTRDIRFRLQGEKRVEAEIKKLLAEAQALSKQDVKFDAAFRMTHFREQYARIVTELRLLGAQDVDIDVVLHMDRSNLNRIREAIDEAGSAVRRFGRDLDEKFDIAFTDILTSAISFLVTFALQLIGSLVAVGGALTAVALAAGQAAAGLGGLAVAGINQVLPVVGLLATALTRVASVMKAVSAQQAVVDKGARQGATAAHTQANAQQTLANAHRSVVDAQERVVEAQERLNQARKDGIRQIEDMRLAETRAALASQHSQAALSTAVATGEGDIVSLQVQAAADRMGARRQSADVARVGGNVNNLASVIAAQQALEQANKGLARANEQAAHAADGLDYTAGKLNAVDAALDSALAKLTDSERHLFRSIVNFQNLFQRGGALSKLTDPIIESFAYALDRIGEMFQSPKVFRAGVGLANAIGDAIEKFTKFMTTGPMREALIFFTDQAAKNLPTVERIFESISRIFAAIGKAASGPFSQILDSINGFLDRQADAAEGNGLAKFFEDALKPLGAFWNLLKSVGRLILALMGPGGGMQEGTRAIDLMTAAVDRATKYVKENSDKVHDFFRDAVDAARDVIRVFLALGKAALGIFDPENVKNFANFLTNVLIPVFEKIIKVVGYLSNGLAKILDNDFGRMILGEVGSFFAVLYFFTRLSKLVTGVGVAIQGVAKGLGLLKVGQLLGLGGAGGAAKAGGLLVNSGDEAAAGGGLLRRLGGGSLLKGGLIGAGLTAGAFGLYELFKNMSDPIEQAKDHVKEFSETVQKAVTDDDVARFKKLKEHTSELGELADKFKDSPFEKAFKTAAEGAKNLTDPAQQIFNFRAELDKLRDDDAPASFIEGLKDRISEFAKTAPPEYKAALDKILGDTTDTLRKVDASFSPVLANIAKSFDDLNLDTGNVLSQIASNVSENMKSIASDMGTHSQKGRRAISVNFGGAIGAISEAMHQGYVSTHKGTVAIMRQLNRALKLLGTDPVDISNLLADAGPDTISAAQLGKTLGGAYAYPGSAATGGWIGHQGERGQDRGLFSLGRGEVVLNHWQQRAANTAMAGRDSISGIVDRMRGYHAGGGGMGFAGGYAGKEPSGGTSVGIPGFPGEFGDSRVAQAMSAFANRFRMFLTDAFATSGHTGRGHLFFGNAADYVPGAGGNWDLVDRAAAYAVANRGIFGPVLYDGRFGTTPYPDHGRGHHLHAEFNLGSSARLPGGPVVRGGGPLAQAVEHVERYMVTGVGGAMRNVAQGAVDKLRRFANRYLDHKNDVVGGSGTGGVNAHGQLQLPRTFSSTHNTDGLDGYPAIDVFASPGTRVLSPVNGVVDRLSGQAGGPGGGGAYGYSVYISGGPGRYFLTHFGSTNVHPGQRVRRGRTVLGTVADYPGGVPDHIHEGLHRMGAGGYAWGGMQGSGGDYLVNRPTMFVAGERGSEVASFRPMAKGGSPFGRFTNTTGDPSYADYATSPFVTGLLGKVGGLGTLGFEQAAARVKAMIAVLRDIPTKTKGGVDLLAVSLNAMSEAVTNVLAASAAQVERFKTHVQRQQFSGGKRHPIENLHGAIKIAGAENLTERPGLIRGISEAQGQGLSNIGALQLERTGLRESLELNTSIRRQAERDLSAAQKNHDKKAVQAAKAAINKAKSNAEQINAAIAQNLQNTVEAREAMQQAIFDATNNYFERARAGFARTKRVTDALGTTDENAVLGKDIGSTQEQIKVLTGQIATAKKSGNVALAQSIQDKIDDLNVSIVEMTAQQLQNSIDEVNTTAQRTQTGLGLRSRLADLRERAGDATGAAVARGFVLADQGEALGTQRNSLYGLLAKATAEGNQKAVEALTDQIAELDTQIAENTQATRDNNTAIRQTQIDAITGRGSFLGGVFSSLGGFLQALGANAPGGVVDTGRIKDTITATIATLGQVGTGLAQQLFEGFGIDLRGLNPTALADALLHLDYDGIETGMSAADKTQFENLINSIIENATAVQTNTTQLNAMNSSLVQSFSSTAWTRFRQAIFTGNNSLMPSYAQYMPHMASGGSILTDGMYWGHAGERVIPATVTRFGDTSSGDNINIQVNEAGQPLDVTHLASRLSFARSTRR